MTGDPGEVHRPEVGREPADPSAVKQGLDLRSEVLAVFSIEFEGSGAPTERLRPVPIAKREDALEESAVRGGRVGRAPRGVAPQHHHPRGQLRLSRVDRLDAVHQQRTADPLDHRARVAVLAALLSSAEARRLEQSAEERRRHVVGLAVVVDRQHLRRHPRHQRGGGGYARRLAPIDQHGHRVHHAGLARARAALDAEDRNGADPPEDRQAGDPVEQDHRLGFRQRGPPERRDGFRDPVARFLVADRRPVTPGHGGHLDLGHASPGQLAGLDLHERPGAAAGREPDRARRVNVRPAHVLGLSGFTLEVVGRDLDVATVRGLLRGQPGHEVDEGTELRCAATKANRHSLVAAH